MDRPTVNNDVFYTMLNDVAASMKDLGGPIDAGTNAIMKKIVAVIPKEMDEDPASALMAFGVLSCFIIDHLPREKRDAVRAVMIEMLAAPGPNDQEGK